MSSADPSAAVFSTGATRAILHIVLTRRPPMRSILLFLLGIPIPIIILIALFVH